MFEAVPQELKDRAAELLRRASRDVYELLPEIEKWVDSASEKLDGLADDLTTQPEPGGTGDRPLSNQEKYDYLLSVANDFEKRLYSQTHIKSYLLATDDVLDALYESKVAEATGPFEKQE